MSIFFWGLVVLFLYFVFSYVSVYRKIDKLILLLLSRHCCESPQYGLDLVKESGGFIERGMVYVHLHRLEERGFIKSEKEEGESDRLPRRSYSLTPKGEEKVEAIRHSRIDGARL